MIHTEEQIIEKAKQVMKDFREEYYSDQCVKGAFYNEEDISLSGKNKGEKHPVWTVGISALFDNEDFLHISDETGEPLYYQNFNTLVFDIEKNSEGKYYKVEI